MGFDIVVVGLVLVLAYQVNQLREARKPRLKRQVLKALFEAEPITVKHDTPPSLTPQGQETWAEPHDYECFRSFWYFADSINKLYTTCLNRSAYKNSAIPAFEAILPVRAQSTDAATTSITISARSVVCKSVQVSTATLIQKTSQWT
jgi:hypothetical protein